MTAREQLLFRRVGKEDCATKNKRENVVYFGIIFSGIVSLWGYYIQSGQQVERVQRTGGATLPPNADRESLVREATRHGKVLTRMYKRLVKSC